MDHEATGQFGRDEYFVGRAMAESHLEGQLAKEKTHSAWLDYILTQLLFTLKDAKALGLLDRKPAVFDTTKFIEWKTNCLEE